MPDFGMTPADDPRKLLEFLHYHFLVHEGGLTQDDPIENVLNLCARIRV